VGILAFGAEIYAPAEQRRVREEVGVRDQVLVGIFGGGSRRAELTERVNLAGRRCDPQQQHPAQDRRMKKFLIVSSVVLISSQVYGQSRPPSSRFKFA